MKVPLVYTSVLGYRRRRRGDHDPRLCLVGMGPGQHRGAHGQSTGWRSRDGRAGASLRGALHGAGRRGGNARRIPAQRVLATRSTACTRRVGDRDGQQQPECGRGQSLRATTREHQHLACLRSQQGSTQKPRSICTFAELIPVVNVIRRD
jgi:hypothetical protein